MSTLQIPTARAFRPFLEPARYKGAFGGRGSGKSHFFAGLAVEECLSSPTRLVCIREIQKDLKQSAQQLILDKIKAHGLSESFGLLNGDVRGPNDSVIIFRGMQNYNSESIKSLEGFSRAWLTEAAAISQRSLDLLRPTIRAEESEIWADWNPDSEFDPIDVFLRGKRPPRNSIVRRVNWSDNPWFPEVLREEMVEDREADPEKAAHIWDGGYQRAPRGAYYAKLLAVALAQNRVGNVPYDPILDVNVSFDLGNGPNMCAWFEQWVRNERRVIDFMQGDEDAANEGWPWYIRRMREKGYTYGKIILPHDARTRQRSTGKGDEEALIAAKFSTSVVSKMDPGERVKLVQRCLPMCYFDETNCAEGLRALKSYRADIDEKLNIDRGPLHDWSSHPADAFGHMCQAYEEPFVEEKTERRGPREGGWMG